VVHAKTAGWQALGAAGEHSIDVEALLGRAGRQRERLAAIHRVVAAQALNAR